MAFRECTSWALSYRKCAHYSAFLSLLVPSHYFLTPLWTVISAVFWSTVADKRRTWDGFRDTRWYLIASESANSMAGWSAFKEIVMVDTGTQAQQGFREVLWPCKVHLHNTAWEDCPTVVRKPAGRLHCWWHVMSSRTSKKTEEELPVSHLGNTSSQRLTLLH